MTDVDGSDDLVVVRAREARGRSSEIRWNESGWYCLLRRLVKTSPEYKPALFTRTRVQFDER